MTNLSLHVGTRLQKERDWQRRVSRVCQVSALVLSVAFLVATVIATTRKPGAWCAAAFMAGVAALQWLVYINTKPWKQC
jgi:hypothetical protein